jgi:hypothetical protein
MKDWRAKMAVLYIYNATSGAGPTDVVSFTLTVE